MNRVRITAANDDKVEVRTSTASYDAVKKIICAYAEVNLLKVVSTEDPVETPIFGKPRLLPGTNRVDDTLTVVVPKGTNVDDVAIALAVALEEFGSLDVII